MSSRRPYVLPLLAALGWLGACFAASAVEEAGEAPLSLGVAPFEVNAAPGASVPDVATLLAATLEGRDDTRVVGPGELGAPADADASRSVVQGWASSAGQLDAVVVGRTTRIGNQLSVDVRLREGGTGAVAETFVQEVTAQGDLDGAVAALAARVVDGTSALRAPTPAPPPPPAPQAAAPAEQPSDDPEGDDSPFGVGKWDSDEPLEIQADDLDISEKEGRRHLVFSGNVRAAQGDLKLSAARLEAIYPEGGGDPERLEADGNVRLRQEEQRARCERAVYDRIRDVLSCRGSARFCDGDSTLAGDVIDIDLERETVQVRGRASVVIQTEPGEACQ